MIAEDLRVEEEVWPEVEGVVGVEVGGEGEELALDVEELVSHVVDLDGDVPPGPAEGEGHGVAEVVGSVHPVRDRLELLLPRAEPGQEEGASRRRRQQGRVLPDQRRLLLLPPLLPLHRR